MQEAAPSNDSGTGLGVQIVTPGVGTSASSLPSSTGAPDPNNGLPTAGPKDNSPLPPVEKVADAPDQVNEVIGQPQPAVQPGTAPVNDKNDESSSKHKPKTGLDKLNPF
jgi:outer membrane protein assembly factor BamD